MSHTLGISDGCLQLGEADVGIPQLGLVHLRNGSSTSRHRQDAPFKLTSLSLSLSSKRRSPTVVISFDTISAVQRSTHPCAKKIKIKKNQAVWCRKRGRKRGRLLRWEFQELRFCWEVHVQCRRRCDHLAAHFLVSPLERMVDATISTPFARMERKSDLTLSTCMVGTQRLGSDVVLIAGAAETDPGADSRERRGTDHDSLHTSVTGGPDSPEV